MERKSKYICEYCNNEFSHRQNMTNHQRKAKYCLKLQGIESVEDFKCDSCDKSFTQKITLERHLNICKTFDISKKNTKTISEYDKKINDMKSEYDKKINIMESEKKVSDERIRSFKEQLCQKDDVIKHLQDKLAGIAEKAASRPTTSNSTTNNRAIFINQRLENLDCLDFDKIKDNLDSFTLEYHRQGAEGYGKHALKEVFNNKLVCTDQSRNKFKFKDKHGNIVEDVGLVKCMEAYVDAYKMKAYEIAQDHYQELAKQFSEKEMDTCPTMEWVIAFAQFKYHNDTAFCRDIVDYMKKNCNDDQKDRKNSGVVVV
jgi:hypothetical protein